MILKISVKEEPNMPSWITHLVTVNKMGKEKEENEFIFANIMPDILEGYHIKDVSKVVKNYETHYPKRQMINGISIPLPNIQGFKQAYKDKMQNPIIRGYYCHLLTDYYWNRYTYQNYFENFDKEKNLVKVKLNNGKEEITNWDEAVRIKQRDFKNFTNYLNNTETIKIPIYSDKIEKYSEDLKEFDFTQNDIKSTIIFIQKMVQNNDEKEGNYQIFTREELFNQLEQSITFIKENSIKI